MENRTNIAKSESGTKSSQSTLDQALALAIEKVNQASAKRQTSSTSSTPTAPTSKTSSAEPLKRRASISTIEESGEKDDIAYVPQRIEKLSTSTLTRMLKESSEDSEYVKKELIIRSDRGDKEAFAAISADYDHVYKGLTFLGRNLLQSMIRDFVGDDRRMTHIILASDILKVRDRLAGPDSSPLEKMLAERIALCQAMLDGLELAYYQSSNINRNGSLLPQHRISMAQSRLVQAIKALATVRKLQIPNVQVNIGEKQVNVARV